MLRLILVLLSTHNAFSLTLPYEPVSADPNDWDPSHPPPAAAMLPGYGMPSTTSDIKELLIPDKSNDGNTAALTTNETDGWQWPAYLAAAANCPPDKVRNWTCGVNCERAGRVKILYAGGNDKDVPWWYVGVSGPTALAVIKGTNTESLRSLLNDVKFLKDDTDEIKVKVNGKERDAFPDSNGAEVHKGFMDVFLDIQPQLDVGIREAFTRNATRILMVGHSLGAAVAQIAAVYLQHEFPNVTVSARTFGLPRVGDGDWADYVDSTLGNRTLHMVNEDDMVPHLPPKILNYKHSQGEVWRKDNDSGWTWCKGQENDDCSDSVDGEFSSKHDGPYAGVEMTCDPSAANNTPKLTTTNWTDTGLVNGGQS